MNDNSLTISIFVTPVKTVEYINIVINFDYGYNTMFNPPVTEEQINDLPHRPTRTDNV